MVEVEQKHFDKFIISYFTIVTKGSDTKYVRELKLVLEKYVCHFDKEMKEIFIKGIVKKTNDSSTDKTQLGLYMDMIVILSLAK